jgi:hypothetical protein
MQRLLIILVLTSFLVCSPTLIARDDGLSFHEDYYLGFSQGVYYGLMLAGTEYDIAWCVKGELAHEGGAMGTGSEFQQALETVLRNCQEAVTGIKAN